MKISKKEAAMLGILGAVLVGIAYYQFVYVKQVEKIEALKVEREQVQTEYDTIMSTIRTIDERKGEIKVFNANIEDKSKLFYPKLVQEKIILEIDKLLKDSEMDASLTFTPVSIGVVELINVPENNIGQSTLKPIVDEYSINMGVNEENEESKEETAESVTTEDNTDTTQDLVASGNTIEQFKVNMSYTGTYDNLKKFIDLIDGGDRKIAISNISIAQKEGQEVSGSIGLEFYGIPKLNKDDESYLLWTLNNKYGKDTPFSTGGATGNTIESSAVEKEKYDFIMTTKPINSDLPTVMIGKANDKENTSYIYADNKGIETVEIELTSIDNKYYYKYKTSSGNYPAIYAGNGEMFTPVGENIILEVVSKERLDDNDLSGVELKVINNTNKVVEVNIAGDDAENPRVVVESEGKAVKVTKK